MDEDKVTEAPKVSYYEWLMAHDIVEHLRPLWERHGFKVRESDGKFEGTPTSAIEGPWHYIKHRWEWDCFTWHHVIFDIFSKNKTLGYAFVPSKCQECYKVVVRPQNLKQLFLLERLQQQMGVSCKCGVEVRDTVKSTGQLYGGYFYCKGLEEGLKRYKEVRKAVNEFEGLGWEVPVILKRACTEYELLVGPSDKWTVTPEQIKIEEMVEQYLVKDDVVRKQQEHIVQHVHRKWIEFAAQHADMTYLEFTNGIPLHKPVVTYHHLAEEEKQSNLDSDSGVAGNGEKEKEE